MRSPNTPATNCTGKQLQLLPSLVALSILKDHVSTHIFFAFSALDRSAIFEQDSYNLTTHHYSFERKVLICFFLFLFFILICSFFLTQLKFVKLVSLTKAFLRNNRSIPNRTKLDLFLKMFWKQRILLF